MKKRIYLSGPITGKSIEEARAAFAAAQEAVLADGHDCYNPQDEVPRRIRALQLSNKEATLLGIGSPDAVLPSLDNWSDCMRIALDELTFCDAMLMLPGWQKSNGARLEHQIALALGMTVGYPKGEVPQLPPFADMVREKLPPLEWQDAILDSYANTPFSWGYHIEIDSSGNWYQLPFSDTPYASRDEAKAAAQEHYTSKVLELFNIPNNQQP